MNLMREGGFEHPRVETRHDNKERTFGYLKRVADEEGVIRMFDDIGEEIRLSDMDERDRADYFSTLLDIVMDMLPPGSHIEPGLLEVRLLDEADEMLGEMTYLIRDQHLFISMMTSRVKEGGNALLLSVLAANENISEIESDLRGDNEADYREALHNGVSHAEALRRTPAYKTRALCGFNELTPESLESRTRPLLVTRPMEASK